MIRCDLEGAQIDQVDLSFAILAGSLLTGSTLTRSILSNANLKNCGLAEVEWENADLRYANLHGSTFHMGSTRSGLVPGGVPSEGTRTGFYTDDYEDRDFKDPREIRKANLCGADLRDAKVDGVDFYLVDLRRARYSTEQAEWFRRCGAILGSQ